MARTLEDFVGVFTIRYGDGKVLQFEPGSKLCIGTGYFGDPQSDGQRIGISIVDPKDRRRILPQEGNPPTFAYLVDGTLNGSSYWLEGKKLPQPLAYQVSMMVTRTESGGLFRAQTILVTVGDPESAGVWGADDESND